ncbi:MAG: restriction endonuclease subunit S, partial [Bacteroidales bacterium]|nr:restriction endonuclease subunit S [Bacteroidales bacterium]
KDLFQQYTGRQRKAAIEDLNNTIRILKFYSNNDFAFKDVHNEELFYQNGKILVEMVTLFQSYRIVYPSKHQFLGDLFEQLLNKGFKQNEGQFFTPTPITRFIWDCLPLQNYISECGLPRVIDYACGAGHFLTEAVEAINAVRKDAENSWVEKHIYGIEKDYRLARVSKISMFMNGAGGSQIIFGDGLENYTEKSIENGTFDILVANPPYSVSAFKSHLKLKNNSFDILNKISNDGSEIETLFVERIAQLLKPKGIAAVVLPSSILSNNSGSYEAAREKILSHFLLRSIVCFGSKTFGATGTNTVVLYLEKYDEPPVQMKLADDVADAILKGDVNDEWEDANVLDTYVRKIEVEKDVYLKFAKEEYSLNEIKTLNYFREYVEAFNPNAQKYPKKLTDEERQSEELRRFYAFVKNIEFQKVKFFALVHKQNTLVITAPADNAQQKAFLGYDWSNRKGAEGIVINQKGGKLYNDSDRFARGTLACAVRNTFADATTTIADDLAQYTAYYSLADMLDFSRTTFDKSIKTKAQKKEEIKSKYDLVKIGAYLFENRKSEIQVNQAKENKNGLYPFFTSGLTVYRHDDFLVDGENIYMATGGNATIQYYNGKSSYSTDTWVIRSSDEGKLSTYYLYLLLQERVQEINNDYFKGTGLKHLQKPDFKQIQIPLPPLDIQQQIVTECSAIDTAREDAVKKIVDLKKEIESTMSSVKGEIVSIAKIGQIKMCKRIMKYETSSSGDIPFYKIGTFGNVADSFITKEKFDEYKTLYPYPKKGQVLISAAGTIGKSILFDGEPAYFQDSNIVWIDNNEEIVLNNYLYRCLQFVDWSKYETNGGIIKRLYNDNLRNTQITAPSLTEQQAIVSKIEKIETEIAALQNTINESAGKKSEILKKWLE